MNTLPIPTAASPRGYLLFLHVMFLALYSTHYQLLPTNRLQGGLLIVVATVTLMVLVIPRTQLCAAWFMGFLTLGNAGVLFASSMLMGLSTDSWMACALMLLLTMASYVRSVLHFSLLSSLIIGGYGAMLH